jgi:hypothetical protein
MVPSSVEGHYCGVKRCVDDPSLRSMIKSSFGRIVSHLDLAAERLQRLLIGTLDTVAMPFSPSNNIKSK